MILKFNDVPLDEKRKEEEKHREKRPYDDRGRDVGFTSTSQGTPRVIRS